MGPLNICKPIQSVAIDVKNIKANDLQLSIFKNIFQHLGESDLDQYACTSKLAYSRVRTLQVDLLKQAAEFLYTKIENKRVKDKIQQLLKNENSYNFLRQHLHIELSKLNTTSLEELEIHSEGSVNQSLLINILAYAKLNTLRSYERCIIVRNPEKEMINEMFRSNKNGELKIYRKYLIIEVDKLVKELYPEYCRYELLPSLVHKLLGQKFLKKAIEITLMIDEKKVPIPCIEDFFITHRFEPITKYAMRYDHITRQVGLMYDKIFRQLSMDGNFDELNFLVKLKNEAFEKVYVEGIRLKGMHYEDKPEDYAFEHKHPILEKYNFFGIDAGISFHVRNRNGYGVEFARNFISKVEDENLRKKLNVSLEYCLEDFNAEVIPKMI